jgi:hypothetical protein
MVARESDSTVVLLWLEESEGESVHGGRPDVSRLRPLKRCKSESVVHGVSQGKNSTAESGWSVCSIVIRRG